MTMSETILLVDDQPENISIMIEALEPLYTLLAATDGATALERASGEQRPDLILLDVMMPGMSGHEVCRRLKDDPETRDIPVIFVTSLSDPDDEARGLRVGASDYLTKPVSAPVVQARVRAHLDLKRVREQLQRQNQELEERVRERTAEVVRAQRERVESLNHFANAMAHQIRNPVAAIGGIAGLMVRKAPGGSPLAEYAEAVREEGLRLESLVREISEYVSLTAGGIQAVSVKTVMNQALVKGREFAEASGRTLHAEVDLADAMVGVDIRLVTTAVAEIIRNAVEFAEGLEADMVVRGRPVPDGGRYEIRVIDDGMGIPEENLPYVTDPFFTTKAHGVGMGLTKAKRVLCDEHGGSLRPYSPPTGEDDEFGGRGTAMVFDLPLA
ncbi:MAG: response regulator [Pseudodesulfovibrio sp.]|uniref:hybrid sensor histidine kinase/response regulator n=1 Tax=Pseudodesulfovibrio sp. TaxID=2035812 RepID=UPI003D09C3FF